MHKKLNWIVKEELTSAGADMAEQKENICWFTVFVGLSKYEYYVLQSTTTSNRLH
jgi:hypothetical protein